MLRERLSFPIRISSELSLCLLDGSMAGEFFQQIEQNRAYLKTWLGWLDQNQSILDSLSLIRGTVESFHRSESITLAIFFLGRFVGMIDLREINWQRGTSLIGYWLVEDAQGRGIMTRACEALINLAFDTLQLKEVSIHCALDNGKSRAIPKRLGFKEMRVNRNAEWLYDHYVDHMVYTIKREEWYKRGHISY